MLLLTHRVHPILASSLSQRYDGVASQFRWLFYGNLSTALMLSVVFLRVGNLSHSKRKEHNS
jgi:hypothetical protein